MFSTKIKRIGDGCIHKLIVVARSNSISITILLKIRNPKLRCHFQRIAKSIHFCSVEIWKHRPSEHYLTSRPTPSFIHIAFNLSLVCEEHVLLYVCILLWVLILGVIRKHKDLFSLFIMSENITYRRNPK